VASLKRNVAVLSWNDLVVGHAAGVEDLEEAHLFESAPDARCPIVNIKGSQPFLLCAFTPSITLGDQQQRRSRRNVLHRRQIARLASKVSGTGRTLVPLRLYFKRGYVKVELGLARGKRLYDKREAIKARDAEREKRRALKQRPE